MNLSGWLPARVAWRNLEPRIEWTLFGQQRLQDPFFEQSLQRQMTKPFHQAFRRDTSVEQMVEWTEAHPGVALKGMIFHMSRCGSTLVSQQMAALNCNIVASEPAPLDAILRAHLRMSDLPRARQLRWLRAMASALGQARCGEQAFYIKTDCWQVHQMGLIREAFPDVPWMFLYRNPIEVMVSHQRMPAAWTIPGLLHPAALQLNMQDWDPTQTEVYCARALAHICEAALQALQRHPGGMLINYCELPQVMYERLLGHFGLPQAQIPTMQKQSLQDSKTPTLLFTRDEQSKQAAATDRLRTVVAEHLQGPYFALEAERHARASARESAPKSVLIAKH